MINRRQVGKYLYKYQGTPNNVTLPHVGSLDRSLATHVAAMTLEVILCQSFGESISNLVISVDWEDLDEAFSDMFTKMMIAHVDMLGPGTKFGKSCQFKCTRIVFKNLAIHIGLVAEDLEILLPHFL